LRTRERLDALESQLEQGRKFRIIYEKELFRSYETFAKFCAKVIGIEKSRAHQLMELVRIHGSVSAHLKASTSGGQSFLSKCTERTLRPLSVLEDDQLQIFWEDIGKQNLKTPLTRLIIESTRNRLWAERFRAESEQKERAREAAREAREAAHKKDSQPRLRALAVQNPLLWGKDAILAEDLSIEQTAMRLVVHQIYMVRHELDAMQSHIHNEWWRYKAEQEEFTASGGAS
jgi:hypothetical protein